MPDLSSTITSIASGPASMESDGQKAVAQSIPDTISADQYLAARSAARRKWGGIRVRKIIKGGQTGDVTGAQGIV